MSSAQITAIDNETKKIVNSLAALQQKIDEMTQRLAIATGTDVANYTNALNTLNQKKAILNKNLSSLAARRTAAVAAANAATSSSTTSPGVTAIPSTNASTTLGNTNSAIANTTSNPTPGSTSSTTSSWWKYILAVISVLLCLSIFGGLGYFAYSQYNS